MTTEQDKISAPRLWLVLARAYGSMVNYIQGSIAAQGLGLSDFMVLEVLLHKGPLTITQIQEKVLLASGSMTAAIDRLEKRGLVVRKSTSSDRRARIVELTREGKYIAGQYFDKHARDLEDLMSLLSEREKKQLYALLKKVGLLAAQRLGAGHEEDKRASIRTTEHEHA